MSTSTAIAVMANTQAAVAEAEAAQAKKIACNGLMSAYEPKTATVQQMRGYADCVNLVYPDQMSPEVVILLKCAVAVVLIGMVIGAVKGFIENDSFGGRLMSTFFYAFMGAMIPAVVFGVLGLITAGVMFVVG